MKILNSSDLCIVIPAYNESKTIGKIVSNSHIFGDVLVIDDASIDKTSNIAELNGANLLINHN